MKKWFKEIYAFNGWSFVIDNSEAILVGVWGALSGEVYVPKYVMFGQERLPVVGITPITKINKWKEDKRKTPEYEYVLYPFRWRNILMRWDYEDSVTQEVWTEEKVTSIIIPDSVKYIGGGVFKNFKALRTVVIPDSVTSIDEGAFEGCSNLSSLNLGNNISHIGQYAFAGCDALESVSIGAGDIRYAAFTECKSLKSLNLGSGITQIGPKAFLGCNNLKEVIIYGDPFEVMVGVNAFEETTKIIYRSKDSEPKQEEKNTTEKKVIAAAPKIDLDKLIDAVVVDGVVTDKERSVILNKAAAAGYDSDDVEILLDARLYEVQANMKGSKQTIQETPDSIKPSKDKVVKPSPATSDLTAGNYSMTKNPDGSYTVMENGIVIENTKAGMCRMAEAIGFEYEAKWTTRQFGAKLSTFIKEHR